MTEEPKSGSVWRHKSGRLYTVLFLTNERKPRPDGKYPRTVVYVGVNGKLWSGSLDDWHRRMTVFNKNDHVIAGGAAWVGRPFAYDDGFYWQDATDPDAGHHGPFETFDKAEQAARSSLGLAHDE